LVRVEQKNGAVVREYIGYDRLEGDVLQARLAGVYRSLAHCLTKNVTRACPTLKGRKIKLKRRLNLQNVTGPTFSLRNSVPSAVKFVCPDLEKMIDILQISELLS
jgi:hypothetical protein